MSKSPLGWYRVNGKFVSEVTDTLYNSIKEQAFSKCLDLIALQIRELIGSHQSAVSYIPGGDFSKGVHTTSFTDKYAKYRDYDVLPNGSGIWALLFEDKKSIRMTEEELYKHPRFKHFSDLKTNSGLEHPPLPGWLAVPILTIDNQPIGALQLSDKLEGEFTLDDQETLERYAQMIASTFEIQFKEDTISEHKSKISTLDKLAHKDYLTKIHNRLSFDDYLYKTTVKQKTLNKGLAIILVDLDTFKAVNDTLGHLIGDQILIETAQRISNCIDENDFVARLGGDEFAIISHREPMQESAISTAKNIIQELSKSFTVKNHEVSCSVSIGISDTTCANSAEKLLQNADMALYRVKQTGRNNYLYYEEDLDNRQKRALEISTLIQKAADNDEFFLLYQPIIDLNTKEISSIEALIRWNHPTLGEIYPDEFIIVAEQCNKITIITEWVINKVCSEINKWRKNKFNLVPLSINISGSDLMLKSFTSLVDKITNKHQIEPSLLQFEVTETALFMNSDNAIKNLDNLSKKGFKIAIDDFGTGYSSLSRLDTFPINILKIDKSFIDDLKHSHNKKIIESIIGIARSYNYKTVMEGIETAEQKEFIAKYGFDFAQGYYFARPKRNKDIIKLLVKR